jgi:hypothetical protein
MKRRRLIDEKNQVYFYFMSFKTLIYNIKTSDKSHNLCHNQANIFVINLLFFTNLLYSEKESHYLGEK